MDPGYTPLLRTAITCGARWVLVGLLVAGGSAAAAPVDLSKAYRQRVALVIGIDTYTRGWSQLSYARSDAEAVGRKLEALGFRVEYLLNEQATRDRIEARFSALKDQVTERDQVFIYFSGHGDTLQAGVGESKKQFGYIIPADGDRRDTFRTGISLEKLRELSGLLHARHVMFALDACFSGAILKPRGERGPGGVREGTPEFIEGALAKPVRFVLTAGTAGQTAVEVDGAGLFTRQLLRALDGAALPPERGAPILTGNDIGSYVRRTVSEIARQRYRKTQTPVYGDMEGEGDGEFLLLARAVPPPPPPPPPAGLGSLLIRPREPAEVWLGDRSLGEVLPGPGLLVMDVRAGTYPVRARFRRAGLPPWEREVRVVADQRVEIDIEPLGSAKAIKSEKDDAEMVLVPAGEFWMGSTREEVDRVIAECRKHPSSPTGAQCKDWYERELPRHRVVLDAFYIDRYEVTNALFERFVAATGHRTTAEREGHGWAWQQKDGKWQWVRVDGAMWRAPNGPGSSAELTHPVVQVSWHDAEAYCKWAGKRLPTEAEWEKAARGTDGRRYPWGEAWDPAKANASMTVKTTTPVGAYPVGASPYGAHDMAGNVAEWVADWLDKDYYSRSPERNAPGPPTGQFKVLRGGAWFNDPRLVRTAGRGYSAPDFRGIYVGFRCARGSP